MMMNWKKKLKDKFKRSERKSIEESIPMPIESLKELLSFLNRPDAPNCDHTHRETLIWINKNALSADTIVPWLKENGGHCDCEVIYNVYDVVGDIVGWHLDEEEHEEH